MALVLCTGVNTVLIQTRKLILEQAGHRVITAITDREITAACEQQAFDVAVIGHTVSPDLKRGIASVIRNHCPAAKILELHPLFRATQSMMRMRGWKFRQMYPHNSLSGSRN